MVRPPLAGPSGKLASVTSTEKVHAPPAGVTARVKIGAAAVGAEKLPAQFEDHAYVSASPCAPSAATKSSADMASAVK